MENRDRALATPPMRNKSMRPGKSTDPHQVQLMIFYEKIKDVDLGGTGPHQVDFRGAISFVPSGCWWKPTVFIKKHKWPSKDAHGPADHFGGRMDSIGQDLRG